MIDSFKIHVSDYGEEILSMSNENIGALVRSLIQYSMDTERTPIEDKAVNMLSNIMVKHIDRDENYRAKKSEAGKKRKNKFTDFSQRDINFEELEKNIVKNGSV